MTRLSRLIRNLLERWLARYYEGIEPPARLLREPLIFRGLRADATADEWMEHAERLVTYAYRQGFVRGAEHAERSWPGPPVDPDLLAADQAVQARTPLPELRLPDPVSARQLAEQQAALAAAARAGIPVWRR